nr:unnamed protein product [Digitaria exilis]
MTTFSSKPPHCTSAVVSSRPFIRRCSSGVSWRWQQRRKSCGLRCSQSRQDSATQTWRDLDEDDRRLSQNAGIFHPSIWGDFFLGYSNPAALSQQQTQMAERADMLKEEVAEIIASSAYSGLHERLRLIDTLERMCLDHLFEEEINTALSQIETADVSDCDLGTVALWFCLLRKHRYRVSPVTLLDDIYDSYATPEECELLTKCIESWDAKAAHDPPECMKFALGKILHSFQAIENMLHQEEKYRMSYVRYFIEDLVRSFNMEREQLIPHVASTIDSYMKEHNVSIEVACEKIHALKEESWNDFNTEWLNPDNTYPKQLLERIFNLTRTMEFMYNQEDNFTNCPNLKDIIHLLFAEPFTNVS